MENCIQCTEEVAPFARQYPDKLVVVERRKIDVKGKGETDVYLPGDRNQVFKVNYVVSLFQKDARPWFCSKRCQKSSHATKSGKVDHKFSGHR